MLKTIQHTPAASATESASIVSHLREISEIDLLAWLASNAGVSRLLLENSQQRLAVAAAGSVATISAEGAQRFERVQRHLESFSPHVFVDADAPNEAEPRWFGGFSFRSNHDSVGVWSAFPAAHFLLPRVQLTQVNGKTWLAFNDSLQAEETLQEAEQRLKVEVDRLIESHLEAPTFDSTAIEVEQTSALMDQATWHRLIENTTDKIAKGDLEKVVLAQALQVQSKAPVDTMTVLRHLRKKYPNCYSFLFEPEPGQAFFGATPELLAKVDDDAVETMAMASSIGRGKDAAGDQRLAEKLLASSKERHEHHVVIEAIQRKLAPLTTELSIPDQPEIAKFSNIQHLKTNIRGKLTHASSMLSVIEAMHPTPAMGGTPRQAALEWIETSEPFPRGWYASPIGWLDAQGNGLFVVAIRSAVTSGQETQLFAGAGIVADSDPEREWAEIQLKFRPILEALSPSE